MPSAEKADRRSLGPPSPRHAASCKSLRERLDNIQATGYRIQKLLRGEAEGDLHSG